MAITLNYDPDLPAVTRDTNFSYTFMATGDDGETIDDYVITTDIEDSTVYLDQQGTVSGKWSAAFSDKIYYVDKGSSTNLDDSYNFSPLSSRHVEPTIVIGTNNVPENKDIVAFLNDTREKVTVTYTVVVEYTNEDSSTGTETFTVTQDVNNSFDAAKTWIQNYYA